MPVKQTVKEASFGSTAFVLLATLLFAGVFDSSEMYSRISGMEFGPVRSSMLIITYPVNELSQALGAHRVGDSLRRAFFEYSNVRSYQGFYANNSSLVSGTLELEEASRGYAGASELSTANEAFVAVYSEENPVRVLLIGDSMMGYGVGSALLGSFQEREEFSAVRHYVCSSGLSRPDYFSWPAQLQSLFSEARYDAVIVMLGTNDSQDFTVEGAYYHIDTPGWTQVYRQRVMEVLSILQANTSRVYWIAMPPMRSTRFHNKMMGFNRIYSECCAATNNPSVRFIPTSDILGDESGSYAAYLEVNGSLRRVRDDDGIHLSSTGGLLVADAVMDYLRMDFSFRESQPDLAANYN